MSIKERLGTLIPLSNLSNYVITFGVEFVIMFISVTLFKLIGVKFSEIGFSEFTINKRLIGFLLPLLLIGFGVSLPKFLPTADTQKQLRIYYSAIIVILLICTIALLTSLVFQNAFSQMVYGDKQHGHMIIVMILYAFSLMMHTCIYNYFRSKFDFKLSSLLQLTNLGIIPLVMYFLAWSVNAYFVLVSLFSIALVVAVNLFSIPFVRLSIQSFTASISEVLRYGINRTPGDVVLGLFLAIPTFIASNYFSLTMAGAVGFCLSLFNIVIALMSPVNIILLPKASRIAHDKDYALLKAITSKLMVLSTLIGLLSFLVIFFAGPYILQLFGISNLQETSVLLTIIFTGIIGYSIFSVIRSIVDAHYATARVSRNILISFVVFIFGIAFFYFAGHFTLINVLITFSISLNLLGLLTYISTLTIHKTLTT